MKKKIFMLATVATLAGVMTACGSAQTNNTPTSTVAPTVEAEATTAPTATTTPTVEPTTEPTATSTPVPTEEPTEAPTSTPEPTAISTPTPEPTATSTPTPEPTATSTPTPEPTATSTPTPQPTATSTPTPEPTATPEPTSTPAPIEAPVVETSNWETVLQKLHSLETYAEREVYIETLDKSKYEVAAVDNFDLIAIPSRVEFAGEDEWGEWDKYTKYTLLDSKHEGSYIYDILNYEEYIGDTTDEYYLMTITELATGETDPWGTRIHVDDGTVTAWTVETLVDMTALLTDELNEYRGNKYAYIKTWETKFYYE